MLYFTWNPFEPSNFINGWKFVDLTTYFSMYVMICFAIQMKPPNSPKKPTARAKFYLHLPWINQQNEDDKYTNSMDLGIWANFNNSEANLNCNGILCGFPYCLPPFGLRSRWNLRSITRQWCSISMYFMIPFPWKMATPNLYCRIIPIIRPAISRVWGPLDLHDSRRRCM